MTGEVPLGKASDEWAITQLAKTNSSDTRQVCSVYTYIQKARSVLRLAYTCKKGTRILSKYCVGEKWVCYTVSFLFTLGITVLQATVCAVFLFRRNRNVIVFFLLLITSGRTLN